MIPITIQCSCGQNFAFEVDPVDGRMPCTVECPTCGVDGTDAANESIRLHYAAVAAADARRKKTRTLTTIGLAVVLFTLVGVATGIFLFSKLQSKAAVESQPKAEAKPEPATKVKASTETGPAAPPAAAATAASPAPAPDPSPAADSAAPPVVAMRKAEPTTRIRQPDDVAIGALFDKDLKTQKVEVTRVLARSPAEKAGIIVGDRLIAIDDASIEDLRLKEVADLIFGPIGSKVAMTFVSSKTGETNRIEFVRKKYSTTQTAKK